MTIYLTSSRYSLMEEMILYGPRSYDHAHWMWKNELKVLKRHRLVSYRGGLWRVTRLGRVFFKQRSGKCWDSLMIFRRIYTGKQEQ